MTNTGDMIAEITGELKMAMVYTDQFDDQIVMKYGVHLAGWPLQQNFTNPSGITSLGNLNMLDTALKDNSCRWERLKEDKFAEWKERCRILLEKEPNQKKYLSATVQSLERYATQSFDMFDLFAEYTSM